MCGFTALATHTAISERDISRLKQAAKGMAYRGPDESGFWSDSKVAMSHVRLSIVGIQNGHQPIVSADGRFIVICNGEIYNHRNLRKQLEDKGHIFQTLSDSETIIYSYIEYGIDFLKKIKGMFAFLLYDRKYRKLICARDIAGKKPLYYSKLDNGLIFSSELKAIAQNFPVSKEINFEIIRQVQTHRYSVSENETFIRSIRKVPPAHAMICIDGRIEEIINYSKRVVKPTFSGSYADAVRKVREALFSAVETRLDAEVPVGLLLSAGIDSSSIACIAKKLGHRPVAFSAGYATVSGTDESHEAEKLADLIGIPFKRVTLDERRFINDLPDIIAVLDEPNADPSIFPQWSLLRSVNQHGYKVLLSGLGGDEIFYGYTSKNTKEPRAALSNASRLKKIISVGFSTLNLHNPKNREAIGFLIRRALGTRQLFTKPVLEYVAARCSELNYPKMSFLDSVDTDLEETIDRTYSALMKIYLPNNGFFLSDKIGMAHSIEVRCPFADKDLIDFLDTLPIDFKFAKSQPKQILKDALRGIVPDFVLDRKKTGFTPPSNYIQKVVNSYDKKFFLERTQTFSHIVTDAMCAKYAGSDL